MDQDISFLLFEIVILLLTAKLVASVFVKIKQSPVLGELIAGIIIGNLGFLSAGWIQTFSTLQDDIFIHTIAELGVIILLFEVGLQSNIRELLKVGGPSLRVAIIGVILPFIFGYAFTLTIGMSSHSVSALFLGAILTATSVGITARVLRDMNKLEMKESKIILGAAVIDDVLGLILMAIVTGIVQTHANISSDVITISIGALTFLLAAIIIGKIMTKYLMQFARHLEVTGLKLTLAIGVCFFFSICARKVGLVPIVGAFAAGLVLDDVQFEGFNEKRTLEEMISPISQFFVPIFFIIIGAQVNLSLFLDPTILGFGLILTFLAAIGKYFSGFAAYPEKVNFHAVGFGMIPRGEVGLIFAAEGIRLSVISETLFAITVLVVILTTLSTPILLKRSLNPRIKED